MKIKHICSQIILNIGMFIFSLCFIMPFLLIISTSLAGEQSLKQFGYTFFPREIVWTAYEYVFKNPTQLINSYKVTFLVSIVVMLFGTFIMCLTAYPLSRKTYSGRKVFTFLIFFTMIFSGGLIPSYIINTQYLKLGNTIWIYILPALCNAWNVIIIRTFFQGLDESISEAARIDGAGQFQTFFRIILPLSKPVIATIALFNILAKWNDWDTALIYIRDNSLYSLQYLLQRILKEAELVKELSSSGQYGMGIISKSAINSVPTDSVRYAMVVVAAGPMLVIFPFFQKYFAKGITLGAVKG